MMAGLVSCGKDDKPNEPVKLKGTDWMLEGIVDVKTGEMRELEVSYSSCYVLHFDTDSTAVGCWDASDIYLHLSPQKVFVVIEDEDGSYTGDLQLFYETIKTITSYTATKDKLKLYCNAEKKYLLYKYIIVEKTTN
jgi:hypothetical protein